MTNNPFLPLQMFSLCMQAMFSSIFGQQGYNQGGFGGGRTMRWEDLYEDPVAEGKVGHDLQTRMRCTPALHHQHVLACG